MSLLRQGFGTSVPFIIHCGCHVSTVVAMPLAATGAGNTNSQPRKQV